MATGDKKPSQAQMMAPQNTSTRTNSLHHQQQQQANCSFGISLSLPKSSHINKYTSPAIFEHRVSCQRQVKANSMSKRQQTDKTLDDDSSVGDLLRLTNLKLSDDVETTGKYSLTRSTDDERGKRIITVHSKMLMDGAEQQQQQPQQQRQQSDSQLTLNMSESGGRMNYVETYFPFNDRHHHHHHHQQQHQHQSIYFTNSLSADANFSQSNNYTTLVGDDLGAFSDDFNQQQHHSHAQPQQQQEEPALEFLELNPTRPHESATTEAGHFAGHTESTQFKLSSCGTYLEPAVSANELNHHNHSVIKTETLSAAAGGADVLPKSVIRLNEPLRCETDDDDDDDDDDNDEPRVGRHYQTHYSPQNSFNSQSDQLSNGQKTSADNKTATLNQQQLEQSEFRLCEWGGCENTFDDMQQFVKHLEERHVNQNPREKNRYFCLWSNCKRNEQEFNARYKLLIHMRVHSGEKPYPCSNEDCKKTFSRLENLKIHQRSHTGEKPYKCSYENCLKSFTNSSDRIKHHKTHKDPRPYCCSQLGCAKRYTDPSSLRKHLRAHKRVICVTSSKAGDPLGPSSQAATSTNSSYYQQQQQQQQQQQYQHQHENQYQHEQLATSQLHPQPTQTIIEASYDPCAMLYEHEQQQPFAHLVPEATYVPNQTVAYDQQQPLGRDNSGSSIANTSFNSEQQIHHPQNHPQNQDQNQDQNQHHQQHHQQRQHLSIMAQSHSQFSRSWCAGTAHPQTGHWGGGGGCGSVTPQVQPLGASGHHSFSSSSLNSNSSQYRRSQQQHTVEHHPQQQHQHQQHQERQQPTMNFSRLMAEEAWQTRDAQHQSLMRSLPAQRARHPQAFAYRNGTTFATSVSSVISQPEGYHWQANNVDSGQSYAPTGNPSRYEPHG